MSVLWIMFFSPRSWDLAIWWQRLGFASASARGFDAQIQYVGVGMHSHDLDIYTLGGGEDAAQEPALHFHCRDPVYERCCGGWLFGDSCASLQIWATGAMLQSCVEGLGLGSTTRPQGKRSIGELVVQPDRWTF